MLHVEHRPNEIYLARIQLHPDYQRRGIGLNRTLLRQAHRPGMDLALDVLAVNQRAQALYGRMGLHEVARDGKDNIKIRMSGPDRPRATRLTDLDDDSRPRSEYSRGPEVRDVRATGLPRLPALRQHG
ncbi:GNAT family N-acetyltransferase [Streptomyces sp. NPDC050516]|uniref:GNAT family N-acetyltransferase n=1 Tax=Streptomyces sp. NPDC050516 TaxID=3365621 RepID=UPI0037B7BB0A